jgi:hypothetical protein
MRSVPLPPQRVRHLRVMAVLLLAVQVALVAHLALTRHTLCVHGLMVDDSASPSLDASPPIALPTGLAPFDGSTSLAAREHDHCGVPSHLRIGRLAERTIGAPESPTARVAPKTPRSPCVDVRRQVLAHAPKQSPPALELD